MSLKAGRREHPEEALAEAPDDFAAGVGDEIRKHRQQRGWTQVELAQAAGLSANYVARLERGELGASLFVATKIATALEVAVDQLAAGRTTAKSGKRRIK